MKKHRTYKIGVADQCLCHIVNWLVEFSRLVVVGPIEADRLKNSHSQFYEDQFVLVSTFCLTNEFLFIRYKEKTENGCAHVCTKIVHRRKRSAKNIKFSLACQSIIRVKMTQTNEINSNG